jgi:hypothetical protein
MSVLTGKRTFNDQMFDPSHLTRERLDLHSAHRKLQQLDRVIVLHAAAHALDRVEQHVWFRRVRIPNTVTPARSSPS